MAKSKKTTMEDINAKSTDELKDLMLQHKKELFNLRFQRVTGEMENTSRFREVRRTIARIATALTAKKTKESKAA